MDENEKLITNTVEALWGNYDADGSGYLDKAEGYRMCVDSLKEMGGKQELNEEEFNTAFAEFDHDGSGQISKGEMIAYFKKMMSEFAASEA